MNWVKIKDEYVSLEYTNAQLGALVRYQLFIAKFGRVPTEKEIGIYIGKRDIKYAEITLRRLGDNLEMIATKVLEDYEKIARKNEEDKLRLRNSRASSDLSQECSEVDKIRLDKSIEYNKKSIKKKETEEEILQIKDLWNEVADELNLNRIISLSDKRISAIKARLKEKEFNFNRIVECIRDSDFLKGNNGSGWKVDFDFIFSSTTNYLKILEERYKGDNNGKQQDVTSNAVASYLRSKGL